MCLFLLPTQTNMSNIIAGNGGRGAAATAITIALILMTSSPAILTTTEATTISGGNAYCNDIQFRTLIKQFLLLLFWQLDRITMQY
jgi:hypothetical protein